MGGRDAAATFISLEACPYSGPMPVGWPEAWTVPGTRLPSTSCLEGLVCHFCNGGRAWQVHLPAPRSQKARGQGIRVAAVRWTPPLDLGGGPSSGLAQGPRRTVHILSTGAPQPRPHPPRRGPLLRGPPLSPSPAFHPPSVSLLLLVFISGYLYVSLTSLCLFLASSLYSSTSPFCCLTFARPPPRDILASPTVIPHLPLHGSFTALPQWLT